MNRRKIAFIAIAPLTTGALAISMYALLAHQFVQPVTPTFTYDDSVKQRQATSNQPTDAKTSTANRRTESAPPSGDQPLAKSTATDQDLAPAQTAIRQSIAKEYTYHPMNVPNDPGYSDNWALQKVNAQSAWGISTGNDQTIVAVIDTGFALNHQDLADRWHYNSGETGQTTSDDRCWTGAPEDKQSNSCDDDNNGYVDDWRGWNFWQSNNNPMAGQENPTGAAVSHGTETAGLAGASGNNNTGITTINWRTKLMPLQVLSDDGPGYTTDVVAAIRYAVDNDASVINLSLGAYEYDPAVEDAVNYASARGVVIVAAAGNCGSAGACPEVPVGTITYPAQHADVIAVGASTQTDARASFSSYGQALDVVAPGAGTIATPTWAVDNQTTLYAGAVYGTSYAAPQVASLAALIKSIRPSSSIRDIAALINATASKPAAMTNQAYIPTLGHGLINAGKALTVAQSLNVTSATPTLLQAGGAFAEHIARINDTIGSGCQTVAGSYCSVRLHNDTDRYDRYLPYTLTDSAGLAGWSWPASILADGHWTARSLQGDRQSTMPYTLGKVGSP